VKLISETNEYSNEAEEEEIKYAMGESDSLHDLQIAQQKANVSLQYTVAVRDAFMTGYKELMNLQF
jgi:flagellar hook-basal body complex protein FliE